MSDQDSAKPRNPYSWLANGLRIVRISHGVARHALAQPKPDNARAKEFMGIARKAGRTAAPHLHPPQHEELRRRIVGDEPMSAEEWDRLWPSFCGDWE
jgi:hypothetical protein